MRILAVLRKGDCIKNATFWKNVQMFLVMLLGFAPMFPQVDSSFLVNLSAGVGGIVVYLTAATSEKVGF